MKFIGHIPIILLLFCSIGHASGFSSDPSTDGVERLICQALEANRIEENLTRSFNSLLFSSRISKEYLIEIHGTSLSDRNRCAGNNLEQAACLKNWCLKQQFILDALRHFDSISTSVARGGQKISDKKFLEIYTDIAQILFFIQSNNTAEIIRRTVLPMPLHIGMISDPAELEVAFEPLLKDVRMSIGADNKSGKVWQSLFFDPKGSGDIALYNGKLWFSVSKQANGSTKLYRVWAGASAEAEALRATTPKDGYWGPWVFDGAPIHPNCFPTEGLSSDNFKEFARVYKIPIEKLRLDATPMYRAGLTPIPVIPSWSKEERITLSQDINSCIGSDSYNWQGAAAIEGQLVVNHVCQNGVECNLPGKNSYISEIVPSISCETLALPKIFDCIEVRNVNIRFASFGSIGDYRHNGYYALVNKSAPRILWLGSSPKPVN